MPLTQTQHDVLAAAATRANRRLQPLPERLKGGAAKKTLDALVARGLAAADDPEGALVATEAGLAAIAGVEAVGEERGQQAGEDGHKPRTSREGTKQAALIGMLRAESGATLVELSEALGWAPHTVRGAMSGALKKKLGLDVRSATVEGRGRVYTLDA
ncbi:MAG: DUF3489 domain-containing protein [Pseudomonadota bacterium]|nr:DUF3489 domain-containing protein [Pseudomonadota bacterium]MEE3098873.1 DUF3489 domain-containing protein [Pseudomonadota bacterium]